MKLPKWMELPSTVPSDERLAELKEQCLDKKMWQQSRISWEVLIIRIYNILLHTRKKEPIFYKSNEVMLGVGD